MYPGTPPVQDPTFPKKARENDVTSSNVTDVTSGHMTSGDVTSGSTPFPNYDGLQVLKTVKY